MRLSKYHGLGNDFIIGTYQDLKDYDLRLVAINLCDRHTGVGADGFIIVKENPLEMIYYNSNGSRAKMCGNGIRCFAKFLHDEGIELRTNYDVKTLAGTMKIDVKSISPFMVEINMGKPDFNPHSIPVTKEVEIIDYKLTIDNRDFHIDSLLLGVPHTVIEASELTDNYMLEIGSLIEKHPLFIEGTNVNFYQKLSNKHIKMQTFERGAGLTLACGTGACATFASLRNKGLVEQTTKVSLPLGDLIIREEGNEIYMMGPAEKVCDIILEELV